LPEIELLREKQIVRSPSTQEPDVDVDKSIFVCQHTSRILLL